MSLLIRVLGTVAITDSGVAVALPGAIPARILALLSTNLDSGLRRDALIDGVWGDAASNAATATLQSHIARLRRAIGPERLVTTAYGYRLALPPSALDAHQFETATARGAVLLQDGRASEAAVVLREALALWRGEAYDGLDDCEPLARERARLGQLRFEALLDRMEADLASNNANGMPTEIEALLGAAPTNERLWSLLMRAWHASGDTGAALAVFGRARQCLLDELGLEPGAALRDVHADLLRAGDAAAPPDVPRRQERRQVAVVAVCDSSTDGDPEVAHGGWAGLRATIGREVTRLDGVVVRSPGFVALAAFGAVTAREDDARRAMLCGRRIAEATRTQVGVASGLALVMPGLELVGAVVDRAVASALGARAGEVVTDASETDEGFNDTQPVPFVGRTREVERVIAVVAEARRRQRAGVVPVIAEAGIGKSRLVAEVRREMGGVGWFQAQCDALGERGGLDPLVDALRECGVSLPEPGLSRAETIAAWSGTLASLAADGLAVLVIEDVHWGSELLLDLLDALAAAPLPSPLVLVLTARPEIEMRRPGWLTSSHLVRLSALDDVEAMALVEAVLSQVGAPDADGRVLAAASGGVPLFAVELGRALASDEGSRIPERLGDLMAARIDSLDPDSRELLVAASIVGSTFWAETIGAVGSPALDVLLRREFIREVHPASVNGMHECRFQHDLIRDAAYGRLLRADRAAGHLATARWWFGLKRGKDDAIIAEHAWLAHVLYDKAGLPDDALDLAITASRSAGLAARGVDTAAAVTFLQRAVALLASHPDEAGVLVELAEALSENRLLPDADDAARRARTLVNPSDGATRLSLLSVVLQLDFIQGRDQDPQILAELLADFPDGPVHIHALGVLATNLVLGQTKESFARAIEVSEQAIAMARALGDDEAAVLALAARGRARLALGDARGLADMDLAQERGPGVLPPFLVLGTRQWYAAAAHHWQGPAAELKIREDLEDYAWRTGMEFLISSGVAERLRCLWELGHAEECVRAADRVERGSDAMTRWVVVQRALALADLGRLDDAVVAEVLATPAADETDLRHVIGTAVLRARHALDQADPDEASAVLTGLGDLSVYAARDGAAEFLPRVLRLADEAALKGFGAELADVTLAATPLGRALTASVRGLVRRDASLLRDAVDAWEALGESVELALARADAC